MASVSEATAFVVNLPLLREGVQLHEGLSMDDFPVNTSSNTQAFFDAVKRRDLHDLPYYLPTAQTLTEQLTEDAKVRLQNQIYIIDVDLPSKLALPFVIHWKAERGVPLRALVVTNIIANLPVPHQTRVTLQECVLKVSCETGLAICNALLMACPSIAKGKGKNNRATTRVWKPPSGPSRLSSKWSETRPPEPHRVQLARYRPLAGMLSTFSRPKISPVWVVTACAVIGRSLGHG